MIGFSAPRRRRTGNRTPVLFFPRRGTPISAERRAGDSPELTRGESRAARSRTDVRGGDSPRCLEHDDFRSAGDARPAGGRRRNRCPPRPAGVEPRPARSAQEYLAAYGGCPVPQQSDRGAGTGGPGPPVRPPRAVVRGAPRVGRTARGSWGGRGSRSGGRGPAAPAGRAIHLDVRAAAESGRVPLPEIFLLSGPAGDGTSAAEHLEFANAVTPRTPAGNPGDTERAAEGADRVKRVAVK